VGDVAEKYVGGRHYRVYGLEARAEAIRGANRRLAEAIGARVDAATAALAEWRGPHADTFAERVNGVLSKMVSLQLAGNSAASRCSSFPDEPFVNRVEVDWAYMGARVSATSAPAGTVSADPAALHAYASGVVDQAGVFSALAAEVTTAGVTADVAVQRPLTAAERRDWADRGIPRFEIETATVWGAYNPVDVTEVFGLADLNGDAAELATLSEELSVWVTAVALAFEHSDRGLLDLLLEHPELAGFLDRAALTEGRMTGEAALMIVLANIGLLDTAGGHGGRDGVVGLPDLEAIANDPTAAEHLRAAAEYLLANRLLLSQASIVDSPVAYEVRPDDARLTADGISLFLEYNAAVRSVGLGFDRLDTAAHPEQDPDGYVSPNDLRAAAENPDLPPELRDAAAFLLDHGALAQRLAFYERANFDRMTYNVGGEVTLTDDPAGFTRNAVIALAVDQQAFASDPAAARQFVLDLPMADRDGNGGLPISLTSDEGTRALANAALLDARFDLSDQHAVISHLPETTGWGGTRGAVEQNGGVRNTLINGFYDLLAHRADELFAGPDLAGHPDVAGHPGANWLMFAPWASHSVGGVITGDTTGPLGITTSGIQQAAADGNQWIFDDIGGRFSAFLEMYEANPHPTETQLEHFFSTSFGDGDGNIRTGFAAYVAAIEEEDPVRRQQLLFEGNTLVATHEQAGAQPYLERVSPGPDSITVRFVDAQVGGDVLDMDRDIPARPGVNNHVIASPLLSMDTGSRGAGSYYGGQTQFRTGGTPTAGVVDLAPMEGVDSFRPGFSDSTSVWAAEGGGDPNDPESLAGSGASSWPDWNERMNAILRLFEQYHTDPELFDTEQIRVSLDNVDWLEPSARP
jgi:hypothetical protein